MKKIVRFRLWRISPLADDRHIGRRNATVFPIECTRRRPVRRPVRLRDRTADSPTISNVLRKISPLGVNVIGLPALLSHEIA
jgi:hypothetical protein